MESLDSYGSGDLAHSLAVDTGFLRLKSRGLELYFDRRSRGHLFPLEHIWTGGVI